MKKKILSHTSVMIVLTVILTFIAASFVMYDKFNSTMKKGVRDEAEYVKVGIEEVGEEYLNGNVGKTTDTRITLTDSDGNVLYDNEAEASKLPNHSSRPEFIQAMEDGQGEIVRYSETLSHQTFYYAVRLNDGRILRLAPSELLQDVSQFLFLFIQAGYFQFILKHSKVSSKKFQCLLFII